MKGSVSSLKTNQNGHRTYGFIYCDDDQQEYFFHKSELRNCNIHQIEEGDVVEFTTQTSNGKVQAVGIRKKYQSEPKANIANPGINPNVNLKIYNEDEQRIISFLKKPLCHFWRRRILSCQQYISILPNQAYRLFCSNISDVP